MSPTPNNCGGDHRSTKIHSITTDVLVAAVKQFPYLKTIIPFGKHPSLFGVNHLLPKLQEGKNKHLLPRFQIAFRKGNETFFMKFKYIHHHQSYLMGGITIAVVVVIIGEGGETI